MGVYHMEMIRGEQRLVRFRVNPFRRSVHGYWQPYFVLRSIFNETTFRVIFASVAGIMVYISLDELSPTAEEYGEHHIAIGGLIVGMLAMAVSLLLFV